MSGLLPAGFGVAASNPVRGWKYLALRRFAQTALVLGNVDGVSSQIGPPSFSSCTASFKGLATTKLDNNSFRLLHF